jgi:hypothetical protein
LIKKVYQFLFLRDLNESLGKASRDTGMPAKKRWMQDVSYLVLCSYIFYIFSPYLPLAADLLAHTFWQKEHLQTAHHAHGSNHVGLEIIKLEKRTGKENADNNQKSDLESFSHTAAIDIHLDYPAERIIKRVYAVFTSATPTPYPDIDYPPPRL